jgi:hypothetical protein
MIIRCSQLTRCEAVDDGETLKLECLDQGGNPVSLLLPFENAESIAMTLPGLLTQAVKAQTGRDNARYIFPLGQWLLEAAAGDDQSVLLTLATLDGFQVSFKIPRSTSQALDWALHGDADDDTPRIWRLRGAYPKVGDQLRQDGSAVSRAGSAL